MRFTLVVAIILFGGAAGTADYPKPVEADVVLKDFRFDTGETLDLKVHYRTIGQPRRDKREKALNAILILHGTTGSGAQFMGNQFAGELFAAGQPLDAGQYYLIIPDAIGHGNSSKPSDGLHAKFPRYGYRDMIRAQHRLLTEGLRVNHLRLVIGTSMGGMHTWLWGQQYPEFMDALLPLACLPTQISGRNRLWRNLAAGAIRTDPEWKGGEYTTQPHGLRLAAGILQLMSSSSVVRQGKARRRRTQMPSSRRNLPDCSHVWTPMTRCTRWRVRGTTTPGLAWRRSRRRSWLSTSRTI
jgi:homoserine O-acetyltransferase